MVYTPKRVFFEEDSLEYPLGKKLYKYFYENEIQTTTLKTHNRVTGIPGNTPQEAYAEGKNTLVVGVRKTLDFESCKPSAHYQLPLVTSCFGKCEYCYLNTQLGKKPYIRVYVNTDEILEQAKKYIDERKPDITLFEGAATSDPLAVEHLTGSLFKTIEFFGRQEYGKFRFVTKFSEIDSILKAKHNGNTTVRFSINSQSIIKKYEHATPALDNRVDASSQVINAGFPTGFIIAPVIVYDKWESEYQHMLSILKQRLYDFLNKPIHFEIISHRYTERAKKNILDIFPNSSLPMDKENRKFKFGQFGYGKYVYNDEIIKKIKDFFTENIYNTFPNAVIDYII